MLEVGIRVIRGPDWKWGNQDDGEGHVGTVVEIGKHGSSTSPDKTVVVQWDSGLRTNYRIGYQSSYDLRVYDNAPIGVKHPNISCDGCKRQGILGMRWKCIVCTDFDLCTPCYMRDKHDPTHMYSRHETQHAVGVTMPLRQGSVKAFARGIFPGAKVVRGPDWDWGNQDGGENKVGKVIDIRGWDQETGRSVACVAWQSGSHNVYRVGHKGKVDLKYIQDASEGQYYKDHLPKLGEFPQISAEVKQTTRPSTFSVCDKVKVCLEVEILKQMQEGHGGWNPKMADFIGKTGTVHRVTERGDIRVQYDPCNTRWTFHPGALVKVNVYQVNDKVKVIDDEQKMRQLQVNHGEWNDEMTDILAQIGTVLKVYMDGDLRVQFNTNMWTLNPLCVTPVHEATVDSANTTQPDAEERRSLVPPQLDHLLTPVDADSDTPEKLVNEAAQGNIGKVFALLTKYPEKVDIKSAGKTALHVASHQGHKEIVKILLGANANVNATDDDGDTALHYCAFGDESDVAALLLAKSVHVDTVNTAGCTPLHVAVNKSHINVVRKLLQHKCNVSLQDSYGDTALHDAIAKENAEIIEKLIQAPGAEFTLRNKRGFNALHHAALKGNTCATEKLLIKARQLVDVKKDDGFSALHLAALNGHRDVAKALIEIGQCEIDIRNNRNQTPLLLAVSQGHTALIELLVTKGADVNVEDEDGDTCIHLALMRQSVATEIDDSPMLSAIRTNLSLTDTDANTGIMVACYLAREGTSLTHQNHQGKSPLDIINDQSVKDLLQQAVTMDMDWTPDVPDVAETPPVQGAEAGSSISPVSPSHAAVGPPSYPTVNLPQHEVDCRMCNTTANCQFMPCGHVVACENCAVIFKKCYICKVAVDSCIILDLDQQKKCDMCDDNDVQVMFKPCGHSISCHECAVRMKKCLKCTQPILEKCGVDGLPLSEQHRNVQDPEQLHQLKKKLQDAEDKLICPICFENNKEIIAGCGHGYCGKCVADMVRCAVCRRPIKSKQKYYP